MLKIAVCEFAVDYSRCRCGLMQTSCEENTTVYLYSNFEYSEHSIYVFFSLIPAVVCHTWFAGMAQEFGRR